MVLLRKTDVAEGGAPSGSEPVGGQVFYTIDATQYYIDALELVGQWPRYAFEFKRGRLQRPLPPMALAILREMSEGPGPGAQALSPGPWWAAGRAQFWVQKNAPGPYRHYIGLGIHRCSGGPCATHTHSSNIRLLWPS